MNLLNPESIPSVSSSSAPDWLRLARSAGGRIPPLWPLQDYVAVNPFVGLADRPFAAACELVRQVAHAPMLMDRAYYQRRFAEGRVTTRDLAEAAAQAGQRVTPTELIAWLDQPAPPADAEVLTVGDAAARTGRGDWNVFAAEEISKWCAAWFDRGQAVWRMPWRGRSLYRAWLEAARWDYGPELRGLAGFRELVASLPATAVEALPWLAGQLGLQPGGAEDYFHRLLLAVAGWSGLAQHRNRPPSTRDGADDAVLDLLVVRLVFELAVLRNFDGPELREFWTGGDEGTETGRVFGSRNLLLWQSALEIGYQRQLAGRLAGAGGRWPAASARPEVQAVFCIDVRSEVFRRALEAAAPLSETSGFAGFFGMPIEYVPLGERQPRPQLPVLLAPQNRVVEHLPGLPPAAVERRLERRRLGRGLKRAWAAFRTSAVGGFPFVESLGLGYAWRLARDSHPACRPARSPAGCGAAPCLEAAGGTGISFAEQVKLAAGVLRNLGLKGNLARLVLLCGHGSTTVNNPYAAALNCGACGGHTGEANARVAAAILNDPGVRAALAGQGLHIPGDTHFLAGLHDTTTDEVTLLDTQHVPAGHQADVARLEGWLRAAGRACRRERASALGLATAAGEEVDGRIIERSRDWSQVRPEWGLAGNAAFIAAPRAFIRGLDLGGRVFLHDYDSAADPDRSVLELILTAPVIVASWINLQYYASTVNHRLWGAGTKVTQDVVGQFGIQQGNGGDLRTGLPWQSLHDGRDWRHEPLRLSVFVAAAEADLDAVLARHEHLRHLVEHEWIHLFALGDAGRACRRRASDGGWHALGAAEASRT